MARASNVLHFLTLAVLDHVHNVDAHKVFLYGLLVPLIDAKSSSAHCAIIYVDLESFRVAIPAAHDAFPAPLTLLRATPSTFFFISVVRVSRARRLADIVCIVWARIDEASGLFHTDDGLLYTLLMEFRLHLYYICNEPIFGHVFVHMCELVVILLSFYSGKLNLPWPDLELHSPSGGGPTMALSYYSAKPRLCNRFCCTWGAHKIEWCHLKRLDTS